MTAFKTKDYLKILRKNGYVMIRRGKGSHSIYSNGVYTFPVSKEVNAVVAMKMIKQYGLVV